MISEASESDDSSSGQCKWFNTTLWSVVLNARDPTSPLGAQALNRLCRTYWYPLYAFARRQGNEEHSAEDLTQAYFERVLESNYLGEVHPEKGKFRSFLLVSFKHFLADQRDRARAEKRGGRATFLFLDGQSGEERYHLEPLDVRDPERLYNRRWALTLLEQARTRLQREHAEHGQSSVFEQLACFLTGDRNAPPYSAVAAATGLTEAAVKAKIFRLRQRYGELIRKEVANTVNTQTEVEEEIRYLISVVGE